VQELLRRQSHFFGMLYRSVRRFIGTIQTSTHYTCSYNISESLWTARQQ